MKFDENMDGRKQLNEIPQTTSDNCNSKRKSFLHKTSVSIMNIFKLHFICSGFETKKDAVLLRKWEAQYVNTQKKLISCFA